MSAPLERWRRFRFMRFMRAMLIERLTPRGRGVFAVLLAAALFGQNLGLPIYRIFGFAVASLIVAGFSAQLFLPRLRISRRTIPHGSAGEPLEYIVEIENLSQRTARDLSVLELELPEGVRPEGEPCFVSEIAAGETVGVTIRMTCYNRGSFALTRLAVASSFPLGLGRGLRVARQESAFLVYPAFTTPADLPVPAGRNHQPGGFLLSSNVGESAELMHVREWRDGDNPRHVHWTSSARMGELVVKVFHEEYFVRLALIVDADAPLLSQRDAFEHGLSIAAGVADWLSRRDYIIDIFAAGETVHHFQAGRALAHLDHVLELLACLDPAPRVDWVALDARLSPEAPRLTGLIAVFTDWTLERERLVAELESQGVATHVIVVREGATSRPLPAFLHGAVVLAPGETLLPALPRGRAIA